MKKSFAFSKESKKALFGSLIGSSIEWYDFFLYGTVASLVFNKLFFPSLDPLTGMLLTYASFGIPFFFRPIGGIIFSHIGDKIGRKKTLVLTLSLMGIATVLIGLLPDYNTIGIWAPILLILLRIIQGIGLGGEWGGALLLAVEYAPKEHRGFFGSIPQAGSPVGMLLGTIAISLFNFLPEQQFLAWGWRIPFLLSIVLVAVGLWIRKGIEETPDFKKAQEEGDTPKFPLLDILKNHRKTTLISIGVKLVESAPFFIFTTFIISYATDVLNFSRQIVLNTVTIATFATIITIPLYGMLSDKIGRKKMYVLHTVAIMLYVVPYFYMLSLQSTFWLMFATIFGLSIVWSATTAVIGTLYSEIFSTNVRYTGITVGYQIGAALGGGLAPLIATYLLSKFNNSWVPVAAYMIAVCIISLFSIKYIRTQDEEIVAAPIAEETYIQK
ncbi:MAG: MFS transporter [Ectobacillus sp.]